MSTEISLIQKRRRKEWAQAAMAEKLPCDPENKLLHPKDILRIVQRVINCEIAR